MTIFLGHENWFKINFSCFYFPKKFTCVNLLFLSFPKITFKFTEKLVFNTCITMKLTLIFPFFSLLIISVGIKIGLRLETLKSTLFFKVEIKSTSNIQSRLNADFKNSSRQYVDFHFGESTWCRLSKTESLTYRIIKW